jgi:arginase
MALTTFQAIVAPYDLDKVRAATGNGPEALIAHQALHGLEVAGTTTIEVATRGASQLHDCMLIDAAIASAVQRARAAAQVPIVLAGNCHSCLGTLAGLGSRAAVIWFDAHGDLNTPETTHTGYFDGMALATALGWSWTALARQIPRFTAVNERDTILIGGRDLDVAERGLLEKSRIAHHAPDALVDRSSPQLAELLADASRPRQAYVHLDLDVIDPSQLHANRFRVPGGVSVAWLEDALRAVRQRHHIAAVQVTAYDPSCAPPEAAASIVNRLLRALLHTGS